jgi:hypothetical protein
MSCGELYTYKFQDTSQKGVAISAPYDDEPTTQ